ncbi:MAG: hypothetical protein IID51_14325 [Proteobacteria bacterium]|nr:hypothetical protein [Pseudomonadota bacterium]
MKYSIMIIVIAMLLSNGVAKATPWAGPGDRQLRRDIEVLSSYGVIDGPITTWPIPWAQISRGIGGAQLEALPAHVQNALLRVRARLPRTRDYRSIGYDVQVQGTNQVRTVRDFGGGAREEVDIRLSADRHFSSTYIRLSVGFRDDDRSRNFQFDDSYLAHAVGNWVVYGGFVDQWWGPGVESGLILSTNARPMPKVGLMRLDPKPFRSKWLSWIGPWQINVFAARQETDRNDFTHPIVAGLRLSARPVRGLDIGFSRILQLCGRGRPCGLSIWKDALIGVGNADNTGTFNEPGNQLAAVDFRYSKYIGKYDFAVYGEMLGEDEDNFLIDKIAVTFGATVGGGTSDGDFAWTISTEYSDTKANRVIGKGVSPGTIYNHFIYTDGYRFHGRSIGASLDTDSRLLTIGGTVIDAADRTYWLRSRYAEINDTGGPLNPISASRETIRSVEAGASIPTRFGVIAGELRVADDKLNTPLTSKAEFAIELAWRMRF